jgi:predicted DNA-binding transcriptional regulator YafY
MYHIFRQSIENKEKIIVFYLDKNNNLSQRIIRILKMNDDRIVAYCYWRKKVRTFKIDNILSAGPIKKKNMGA